MQYHVLFNECCWTLCFRLYSADVFSKDYLRTSASMDVCEVCFFQPNRNLGFCNKSVDVSVKAMHDFNICDLFRTVRSKVSAKRRNLLKSSWWYN